VIYIKVTAAVKGQVWCSICSVHQTVSGKTTVVARGEAMSASRLGLGLQFIERRILRRFFGGFWHLQYVNLAWYIQVFGSQWRIGVSIWELDGLNTFRDVWKVTYN